MADESQESLGNRSVATATDSIFHQNVGSLRGGYDNNSDTSLSAEAFKVKVNNLKYSMETWREVLIHMHAVLVWKRPFYPMVLWALVSMFFGIVYYARLSALTTLAVLAMFAVISDYLVPIMQTQLFNPSLWTGLKEKNYEEVCTSIVYTQETFSAAGYYMNDLKVSRPSVYFFTVLLGLLALAWVGSLMDNLFLTYVIVCSVMMVPGLVKRGYLQKYFSGVAKRQAKRKVN